MDEQVAKGTRRSMPPSPMEGGLSFLITNCTDLIDIEDLKSLRATGRKYKKIVDEEIERRSDHRIQSFRGPMKYKEHIWSGVGNAIDYTISKGWSSNFLTQGSLVNYAMQNANPNLYTLDGEEDILPILNAENATQRLHRNGVLDVTKYLTEDNNSERNEDNEDNWRVENLEWKVSITRPKRVSLQFARKFCLDSFEYLAEFEDEEPEMEDRDDVGKAQAKDFSWILLFRADPNSFQYSSVDHDFLDTGRNRSHKGFCRSVRFRTFDGQRFEILVETRNYEMQ